MADQKRQPDDQDEPREWDVSDAADLSGEAGEDAEAAALRQELNEEKSRSLRLMADFNNYQKRALQNERLARVDGAADVVKSVVGVIDHFDIALGADLSKATLEQIVGGVRVIREELLKALARHNVGIIHPQPGELFEPGKHEAVVQMPAEGVQSGHIVQVFQAGYTLGGGGVAGGPGSDRVLRPAKVAVAP